VQWDPKDQPTNQRNNKTESIQFMNNGQWLKFNLILQKRNFQFFRKSEAGIAQQVWWPQYWLVAQSVWWPQYWLIA
jgi:hypothetical protein